MLLAGTAQADITPRTPVFLAGYPHVARTSEGMHDPLLISAVYLENDGCAALLMSLDLLFIGIETARRLRIETARRLDIPEENVFISCTHTHSGPLTADILAFKHDLTVPEVDWEYVESIINVAINAAGRAKHSARKAELAWTPAEIYGVGCNRHATDLPRDSEAGILVIKDQKNGKIMALSLIYSMHATVLHEDSKLISGDFPAFTRQSLTEKFGAELVVTYHMGPAGNQSPRYHVKAQTFAEAERLGRKFGSFVVDAVTRLKGIDFNSNPIIHGSLKQINPVPRKIPTIRDAEIMLQHTREEFEPMKKENVGHGPIRTAECAVFGAEENCFLAQCQNDGRLQEYIRKYSPCDIQTLRIGNACLVGLPGELFVEFGLEIKSCAGIRTFVVSLVNGDLQGYIVTPEAAEKGGYEAANALFASDTGPIMVAVALDSLNKLGGMQ